jgi:hypothetical protein
MAFPAVTLLDALETAEEPLSDGGKFTPLPWAHLAHPGAVAAGAGWHPTDTFFEGENGARWNPAPSGAISLRIATKPGSEERYLRLWACLTTEQTGYALRLTEQGGGAFTLELERWTKGSKTVLATQTEVFIVAGNYVGLLVASGKVSGWYGVSAKPSTEALSASDSTYTSGYVGFSGAGNNTRLNQFGAEPLPSAPVITPPAEQVTVKGSVATPVGPSATGSPTSWENPSAHKLPAGLSLNTGTGEITGTPTAAVGSYTVGLKATNGAGTSPEVTFVWKVEPAPVILEDEAAYLYQQLAPMAGDDAANGYATAHLCAVLMKPVELVSALALADGEKPGWRKVQDVDDCPAQLLPWLGQFNGTPLDDTEPEEEARRKIREARGSHRGTTRAIVSDVKATLTGTQSVDLIERDGGPFENLVITRTSETPSEAATLAALNNRQTKPLGATYSLVVGGSIVIDELIGTIDVQVGTIDEYSAIPA